MHRHKDLKDFLPSEEQLKPMDEIVEKFRSQKLRILEEGILSKIVNFLTATPDINTRFGTHAGEYFRLRGLVPIEFHNYEQNPTMENELHVMSLANLLRNQATALNEAYSDALGKNLVEEEGESALSIVSSSFQGVGELAKKNEELTKQNAKLITELTKCMDNSDQLRKQLDDAKQEIERLSNLVRLLGGNPNRTDSGDVQGGEYHE